MISLLNSPFLVFVVSIAGLWLASSFGGLCGRKLFPLRETEREGFSVLLAATLTLLGLIIGFSFSMAISRYDQRKNYEEAEANAIGTEYVRADLLAENDAKIVRGLLKKYLDQRISYYSAPDAEQVREIRMMTEQTQNELWAAIKNALPGTQPTPVVALAVSGMNDVLNSQGYTQAAWANRIPVAAWCLMATIAVCCSFLMGYGARTRALFLIILPLVVSVSFTLIADIDSPRGGVIRVLPENLISLARSLR